MVCHPYKLKLVNSIGCAVVAVIQNLTEENLRHVVLAMLRFEISRGTLAMFPIRKRGIFRENLEQKSVSKTRVKLTKTDPKMPKTEKNWEKLGKTGVFFWVRNMVATSEVESESRRETDEKTTEFTLQRM